MKPGKTKGDRSSPFRNTLQEGIYEPFKDGSHFVRVETHKGEDRLLPLLPHKKLTELLPKERILVRLKNHAGGAVAQFHRVKEPRAREFTGTIEVRGRGYILNPDDLHPPIPLKSDPAVEKYLGKRLRLKIPADSHHPPFSFQILELLPPLSPLKQVTRHILDEYGLSQSFPREVIEQAEKLKESDGKGRVDLRDLPFVTIDGVSARDFDDAIYATRHPDGYELHVAIADVSAYVVEGEPLDRVAYQRATSIYLVDDVIPMLPERLSNDLCSLVPGKSRVVQGVRLILNRWGIVERSHFFEGIILSRARLNYTEVSNYLEEGDTSALKGVSREVKNSLKIMKEITELLMTNREARGGLDFDLPESEFIIGLQGEISGILYPKRRLAHKLVEEFMILANCETARALSQGGFPLLYRCHPSPPEDRYRLLRRFTQEYLGLKLPKTPSPGLYSMILNQVRDTPMERLVSTFILRSLAPAQYSVENIGHFGLNLPLYCHFTSPIRRYPDLVNHRLLKTLLHKGGLSRMKADSLRNRLREVAHHCTEKEAKAVEIERHMVRLLKVQFMKDKIGARYKGVVSGLAPFGVFVELDDYLVDGLIPLEALPQDEYRVTEEGLSLTGRRKGMKFFLGDEVEVELKKVDLKKGHLDFALLAHHPLKLTGGRK